MSTTRATIITFAALTACADLQPDMTENELGSSGERSGTGVLRVMTRNLYVGANVDPIITSPPEEVPLAVARAFATLQRTDFEGRMDALAAEIAGAEPDLVGLQEVSLIRIQDPGDLVMGGTTPAETVVHDFLPVLLDALAARGAAYHVAAMVENTDAEAPMITPDFTFVDVRLTDYDVLLARDGVDTALVAEKSYAVHLPLPNGLDVRRGFLTVDATVRGRAYRVASTHLEDALLDAQLAQAYELIGALADSPSPVILLGDFNSHAPSGATYQMLLAAGYRDSWIEAGNRDPGFTCCQDADLGNATSALSSRIDFVFTRGLPETDVRASLTQEKAASGLWSSDHAGVSVKLRVLP